VRSLLQLLGPYYRREWRLFLWGVCFVLAVNGLALYAPWATGHLIDKLVAFVQAGGLSAHWREIAWLLTSILLSALVRGALMVGMRQTLVVLSRRVENAQRAELVERLLSWDLPTLRRFSGGELLTYFTEDLNRIRNFTGPVILYGLNAIALLLSTGVLMVLTAPLLGILALLPLVILPFITYYLRQKALRLGHAQQAAFAHLSGFVQQVFPYLRALKAMASPQSLVGEFTRRSETYRQASLSVARVEASLQPLSYLFIGVSMSVVLLYGGYEVMQGRQTLGTVSSFSLYLLQLLFPMGAIGWLFSLIQQAKASAERLLSVMAVEPAITYPAVSPFPTRPAYRWENLGYRYSDEGPWVFRGLYGEVKEGQHIGISAPLGGGKTTLARLLVRQMAPTEGQVWLGDLPLQTYSLQVLRAYVGYVPQEPVLFEGSVADNFRLVRPEASRREIWQALEWVGLAEEVQRLPKGILTPIGEWGQQVSGGQRHRLSLALTLIRRPRVLILDDPFAPLDSQKIAEILENLQRHFGEATWIVFTHRQEVRPYLDRWWEEALRGEASILQKEG
jgi:ATP-binding cassette subfamily B multidrug efflux pump